MAGFFSVREMREVVDSFADGVDMGATYHIDHDDCGDKRGRLYVTNTGDGKYLLYCHNCGSRGCLMDDTPYNIRRRNQNLATKSHVDNTFPLHLWPMLKTIHTGVKSALLKYLYLPEDNIPTAMFNLTGGKCFVDACAGLVGVSDAGNFIEWGTNPSHESVSEVPTAHERFDFAGKQAWYWDDGKWRKVSRGCMGPALFYNVTEGNNYDLLVICEDPISAAYIVERGADALCLFGTNIRNSTLCDYAIQYRAVLVWLDCDSDENRKKGWDYSRAAGLMCDRVSNFSSHTDQAQLRYIATNSAGLIKHDPKNYKEEYVNNVLFITRNKSGAST